MEIGTCSSVAPKQVGHDEMRPATPAARQASLLYNLRKARISIKSPDSFGVIREVRLDAIRMQGFCPALLRAICGILRSE